MIMKTTSFRLLLSILLLLVLYKLPAQELNCRSYDWDENPVLTDAYQDTTLHAVYLISKVIKENVYEEDDLLEYHLIHKKIKVLSNKGINEFNTYYLPSYRNSTLIYEKARVIHSDSSITELDESDVKTGVDEESGTEYRFFSFEGVEKGNEIEYIYLIKRKPYLYGTYFTVQSKYPILKYNFEFYAPENLLYQFKTFNGLEEIKMDTSIHEYNYWSTTMENIPGLKNEPYSNYDNALMGFCYKLHKNYATGRFDISSYGPWSKNVYNAIHSLEKKQTQALKKLLKEIKPKGDDLYTKIRSIEDYLKKEFTYTDLSIPELAQVESIIKNKAFNRDGSIILYANLFKQAGIKYQIVVTSDRFDLRFDPKFQAYCYLDAFLFYFPEIEMFLSPKESYSRLGYLPDMYINNYGLFIKEVSLGDFVSGIGKIGFIPPPPMEKTYSNLDIDVTFSDEMFTSEIKVRRTMAGYNACYYQPIFELIKDQEDLEKFRKEIGHLFDISDEPVNIEFLNDNAKDFGVKPLIIKSDYKTDQLTEVAGDEFLFKIGQLIGPQMELYNDDKDRKLDIELPYVHSFERDIRVEIPEGYNLSNLESLQINESYIDESSDTLLLFQSDYKLDNNMLSIHVLEYYKKIVYPKQLWEDYRRVVNSAANFNKATLIFTEKK